MGRLRGARSTPEIPVGILHRSEIEIVLGVMVDEVVYDEVDND
jgi:hypothetical protein